MSSTDYYFNQDGLMVFTEAFHLKRGYCCGSGCLHCPFRYQNVRDEDKKKALLERGDKD